MVITILAILVILGVFAYFWWYGHQSSWGILAVKYPADPSIEKLNLKGRKKESVNIEIGNKWKQGWNAVRICLNETGCHLVPEKIFQFFVPAISIPWGNVEQIRENTLFSIEQTEILLKDTNASVFLPKGYKLECNKLLEKSKDHGSV